MNEKNGVKGGQGRTAEEIEWSAQKMLLAVVVCVLVGVLAYLNHIWKPEPKQSKPRASIVDVRQQ